MSPTRTVVLIEKGMGTMETYLLGQAERLMRRLDVGALAFFVRWLEMVSARARRVWVVQNQAESAPIVISQ